MKHLLSLLALALTIVSCQQQPAAAPAETTSLTDQVTELMMSRRSIRQYQDTRISRDTLQQILDCGINAPNGMNRQAYEVRVIDNPELVNEISNAIVAENPKMGERPGFKNIFVNAPCVLCIAADKSYDMSAIDCGLLGENIILKAWSMGIGSCCLGGPVRMLKTSAAAAPYLERLNFSEGYDLILCIALGYPAEQPDAKPRNAEKVQFVD